MKKFWSLLYRIAAAFGVGVGGTVSYRDEATKTPAPIEGQRIRLAPGGTLAAINKEEGFTIAGGPGSQKIGDTFMALPQAEREAMIAARKGVVRRLRPGENDSGEQAELGYRPISHDRIAAGLASRAAAAKRKSV